MFQSNQDLNKIKDLRHQRRLLREKIKKRSIKFKTSNYINPDTYNIIKKYYELTDKLYNLGFITEIKADYLTPSYWHMSINDLKLISSNELKNSLTSESKINIFPTPSETPVKKINKPIEQSYYIFNLAWTDMNSNEQEKIVSSLKNYFNMVGLKEDENNNFKYGDHFEHIIKYKTKCSSEIKNTILKSSQFLLNNFSNEKIQQNTTIYINKNN